MNTNTSYSIKSYENVYKISTRLKLYSAVYNVFVAPHTSMQHGTKKRNTIFYYDTANIRRWSYISFYYTHTWWKRFKNGRESLGDDERNGGRPSAAVHDENIAKTRALLLGQHHLTLQIITEEFVHRVHRIRTEYRDPGSWTLFACRRASAHRNVFSAGSTGRAGWVFSPRAPIVYGCLEIDQKIKT